MLMCIFKNKNTNQRSMMHFPSSVSAANFQSRHPELLILEVRKS